MGMSENQDTEFTLGTGKLLAFFFGMVIICGIFFSLGYGVGRNSSSAAAITVMDSSSLSSVASSGATKPHASKVLSSSELAALPANAQASEEKPCAAGDATCVAPGNASTTTAQESDATKNSASQTSAKADS